MRYLWLRIYLALVAVLLVFALGLGFLVHRQWNVEREQAQQAFDDRLSAMAELLAPSLPASDAPPAEMQRALHRWGQQLRAPLALEAADGTRLATSQRYERREAVGAAEAPFVHALPDGRRLLVLRPLRAGWRSGDPQDPPVDEHEELDVVTKKARFPNPLPRSGPTPSNVVLRRAVRQLADAADSMLAERATRPLADGEPARDMLDLLLATRDDDGRTLSAREVRDQVVTFIVAGHETVASALTWAWDLLATHPDAAELLRAEVDALDGPPTFDDLRRLPYAAAVMDETLRLYPPAWVITRRALEDDVLAGVPVAANSLVIVSPWLVHRHESQWDRPEEFDPSRFLTEAGERRRDVVASAAYIPFGAGPRLCIGRDMALLEGALVLAALARAVTFHAVQDSPRPVPLVTIRPDGGLPLRVRLRRA